MDDEEPGHLSWAYLRFSIIGPLLASPPPPGTLGVALDELAARLYRDPKTGKLRSFGRSTIEKWYYAAKDADDPIAALSRKVRHDRGTTRVMSDALVTALGKQYQTHRGWTYQLHHDNLVALVEEEPKKLGSAPSYSTTRRYMKAQGWTRKKVPRKPTAGHLRAVERLDRLEVRSFERENAHDLWHWDFHVGSLPVVDENGEWSCPHLMGVLDDCSRVCCHAQWFPIENAPATYWGLRQAGLKWGLPREGMSDNGGAMIAEEITGGLDRLGVVHGTTLPYSAYQNGKQESFWNSIEGRLLPMLERIEGLTLAQLNHMTHAWITQDYNRKKHSELDTSPMKRFLAVKDRSRPAPDVDDIERAFTRRVRRTVRRSDTTITVDAVRFELPSKLRNHEQVWVRYARWDLSKAWIVDPDTGEVWARIRPQNKTKNADGQRRALEAHEALPEPLAAADPLPPLMRKILREHAATGLPPAYVPFNPEWRKNDA